MRDFILAIDQGTTSTRSIVFDPAGRPVAAAQREHRQSCPQPGRVEHDPAEIWTNTAQVTAEAVERADASGRIAAVGITNQRETILLWNRADGRPRGPALVWQDQRTAERCAQLEASGRAGLLRARTGLPPSPYFSATKLAWMLDEDPALRAAAARGDVCAGTIDTWLIWNLTGAHVIDVTNASRTQLMDLVTRAWDDELLDLFDIPRACLPRIVPSADAEAYGRTRAGGPLGVGVPVAAALGDQQAALLGQCAVRPGDAKCTYGTGAFLLLNTGATPRGSEHGLLTTVAWELPGLGAQYALEGAVAVAGALVQWLRDNLGIIERSEDIEKLAESVADTGDVFIVPAFAGLLAPHWRSDARGVIVGLTGHTGKAHLARAALESTAHQVADVLDAMTADAGTELPELRVDGGMVVNDLLMQMQADLLGIPCARPPVTETTALGAAYAAGLGIGLIDGVDTLDARRPAAQRWTPRPEIDRAARRLRWRDAVERSLGWAR